MKIKNYNITIIETWLLNNLFLFLLILIGGILILYIGPIILDAKIYENGKLKDLRLLDLKFTITTIGAIFVFWYGYKKYERDKEIELINNFILLKEEKKLEKIIKQWSITYYMYEQTYIKETLIQKFLLHYELLFIRSLYKYKGDYDYRHDINETLRYFNKNKYILNFLKQIAKDRESEPASKEIKNILNFK